MERYSLIVASADLCNLQVHLSDRNESEFEAEDPPKVRKDFLNESVKVILLTM